jgi:hypothetical protein
VRFEVPLVVKDSSLLGCYALSIGKVADVSGNCAICVCVCLCVCVCVCVCDLMTLLVTEILWRPA